MKMMKVHSKNKNIVICPSCRGCLNYSNGEYYCGWCGHTFYI